MYAPVINIIEIIKLLCMPAHYFWWVVKFLNINYALHYHIISNVTDILTHTYIIGHYNPLGRVTT